MALSIKDPETDHLARQSARLTGESLTDCVRAALRDRPEHEQRRRGKQIDRARIAEIVTGIASLPAVDDRSPTSSSATMSSGCQRDDRDTSALIAIAWDEPERVDSRTPSRSIRSRLIAAASVLEGAIVMMRRAGRTAAWKQSLGFTS